MRRGAIENLAHEGVPIACIARSAGLSFGCVLDIVRDAVEAGRIIEMPASDWRPGTPRGDRAKVGRVPMEKSTVPEAATPMRPLPVKQRAIVRLFLSHPVVTWEMIREEMMRLNPLSQSSHSANASTKVISRLRGYLEPRGVSIYGGAGSGWAIADEQREAARKLAGDGE